MARTSERGETRTSVPSGRPAWRRAPTRLLHRPVLFLALAAGALLVAVTVATFPLFISTAQSELLTATLRKPSFTRYGAGITYRINDVPFGADDPNGTSLLYERLDAFSEQVARSPVLDPALESLAAPAVFVTGTDGKDPATGPVDGRLFYGDQALEHVRVIEGRDGPGVWLSDFTAEPLHVHAGDRVQLHDGASVVTVRVDGVYAAIYAAPHDGYWQPWESNDIYQACPDCALPPPFILADRQQLLDLQAKLQRLRVDQALQAPVRADPPLSIDEMHTLGGFADDLQRRMQAGPSRLGSLFSCCGRFQVSSLGFGLSEVTYHSAIGSIESIAEQRSGATRGPALVLLIAGLAIAFAAMAAAGVFAFSSRPDEAGLLRARGWGPVRVGGRTALESLLPVLAGAVAGLILAFALIAAFGPDGAIGPDARRDALTGVLVAAAAAVGVVGIVAALVFVSSHEHKARFTRFLMWVPWEILAFAGALALSHTLRTAGGAAPGVVRTPRAAVFLYPLSLALGVGILGARGVAVWCTRRARSPGGARVSPGWLATRRFASSARLGVVFIVAATLAVAIFVSAGGLVASLRTTVEAKAAIFVGSDVQVQIVPGGEVPTDFPFPVTEVQRALGAGTFDGEEAPASDLLVVDPATFAAAAYWNPGLSAEPLEQMVARLGTARDGAVPIILANGGDARPATMRLGVIDAPVKVVGRAASFPGATSRAPLVVISRDALVSTFKVEPYRVSSSNSTTELWFRGPTDQVLDAIDAAPDIQVFYLVTADEVADIPLIREAVNTFLVLDVLGLVALLLVVVLAVVYLQARQRSRVLASALSTRMGITSRTLRAALVLELGGLLLVAVGLGGLTGVMATPVVVGSLDPIPTIPPPPIAVLPWTAVALAGCLLVAASFVGGWLADRATRRASLGEVMRVAGW